MAITSEEVNYLVYRYLQESGFSHTAFTFAHESLLSRSSVVRADVPPGALVAFLQKGLQYVKIEQQIVEDGYQGHLEAEASLLQPRVDLLNAAPPRQDAPSKHQRRQAAHAAAATAAGVGTDKAAAAAPAASDGNDKGSNAEGGDSMDVETSAGGEGSSKAEKDELDFPAASVAALTGHTAAVQHCPWNPKHDGVLCTGGGEGPAMVWDTSGFPDVGDAAASLSAAGEGSQQDVTALQWSPDGEHIAAGAYDGAARVWRRDGTLVHTLASHKGPVFCLRWNRDGSRLLTGSYDKTAVLWDGATGNAMQMLQHHSGPVLDADFRTDDKFATCSSDRTVLVYSLGRSAPDATFIGHQDEVNALRWKPADSLLASCSDDRTCKVWSLSQSYCVADLRGHEGEVYTLEWGPSGSAARHLLATASFDRSVKIWDVEHQEVKLDLSRHTAPLSCLSYAPGGEYIASGSLGGQVFIWSATEGKVVRSYKAAGDVYSVSWNGKGDKISVGSADKAAVVLDFRR